MESPSTSGAEDDDESTTSLLRRQNATEFLLNQAKAGKEGAWDEICKRYRELMLRQIRAKLHDASCRSFDEEDVLQEAFQRAWRKLDSFTHTDEGSFRAWLWTLVLNEFRNQLKAREAERRHITGESQVGDLAQREDAEGRALAEREQANEAILEAMGKMEEEDREVIRMRLMENKSFEAVGLALGCGKERAKTVFERAMERLQRFLS